ncbi:MAG TPA: hypothetical protein VJN18_21110 [Polyangiaceae bacterium]|nr:hypothetical protein [Polyangiaceae bacterium]
MLLLALACARTGLHPGDLVEDDELVGAGGSNSPSSGGSQSVTNTGGAPILPLPTAGMAGQPVLPQAGQTNTPIGAPTTCEPSTEACNGRDDDCNGAVDDLPATPCDGGGFRFCVAGRLSECPRRCEVCVPGSIRICQNPFCTFWGEQECAADGQGFGGCREADPPPECAPIAKKKGESPELEQCCIDNGYCCLDEHDLDDDGNHREMLGACADIACQ